MSSRSSKKNDRSKKKPNKRNVSHVQNRRSPSSSPSSGTSSPPPPPPTSSANKHKKKSTSQRSNSKPPIPDTPMAQRAMSMVQPPLLAPTPELPYSPFLAAPAQSTKQKRVHKRNTERPSLKKDTRPRCPTRRSRPPLRTAALPTERRRAALGPKKWTLTRIVREICVRSGAHALVAIFPPEGRPMMFHHGDVPEMTSQCNAIWNDEMALKNAAEHNQAAITVGAPVHHAHTSSIASVHNLHEMDASESTDAQHTNINNRRPWGAINFKSKQGKGVVGEATEHLNPYWTFAQDPMFAADMQVRNEYASRSCAAVRQNLYLSIGTSNNATGDNDITGDDALQAISDLCRGFDSEQEYASDDDDDDDDGDGGSDACNDDGAGVSAIYPLSDCDALDFIEMMALPSDTDQPEDQQQRALLDMLEAHPVTP